MTGGTGRVGSAIAERLQQEGWNVFAAGRADGDLSTAEGARKLVATADERLAGLDLLVYAAGEGFTPIAVERVEEPDWDTAFGTTAKGTFFVVQSAAPLLLESRGTVVIIEDVAAYQPWPSFAPHCAAKAAQAMLTRIFARALAPDVRVCGIAPGPVAVDPEQVERRSAETLVGRVGTPDDVAETVVFLTGAAFVTGTTFVVDGGLLLQSGRIVLP